MTHIADFIPTSGADFFIGSLISSDIIEGKSSDFSSDDRIDGRGGNISASTFP